MAAGCRPIPRPAETGQRLRYRVRARRCRIPHNVPFDGISLVPVLKDASGPRRQWSYCWYHRDGNRDKATQHARTVQYKLYATGELYDVIADPQEEHPLAQDAPELKQTRALLQQVLNEMASTEWQKTK